MIHSRKMSAKRSHRHKPKPGNVTSGVMSSRSKSNVDNLGRDLSGKKRPPFETSKSDMRPYVWKFVGAGIGVAGETSMFETALDPQGTVIAKVDATSVRRLIEVVGKREILRWKLPVIIMDSQWTFDDRDGFWYSNALGYKFSSGQVEPYRFKISKDQYLYTYGIKKPLAFRLD